MTIRPNGNLSGRVDLVVAARSLVTMDANRRVLEDAGVAVSGSRIVDIDSRSELRERYPGARWVDEPRGIVAPGYIDAHQHLTGDRLVRSMIPDSLTAEQAIFQWAVPIHVAQRREDEQIAAALACVDAIRNGVTTIVEAGTVASWDAVAESMIETGIRGTVATWGWDLPGAPFSSTPEVALDNLAAVLDAYPPSSGRVRGSVALVGHDLVSDELYRDAASLARDRGALLTFHLSLAEAEVSSFERRSGKRPVLHLADLGVLGPGVLISHALHLGEAELDALLAHDTALAYCPWTYFRLATGAVGSSRHLEFLGRGGRVAFGCDSENSGDLIDVLRTAAVACGIERDRAAAPGAFDSARALEVATIGGARAIGRGEDIGSIEIGKRADLVVHRPDRHPIAGDPVLELIWGTDGRSVVHVVIDGLVVVDDGRVTTVDVPDLVRRAERARTDLLGRAGIRSAR
ncbi:MAG TPA: amidohydrolase family protein [Acidimicrobiales bacterium]|nr:amidohydrolase family protein [Acidimicrobiales bacterium]